MNRALQLLTKLLPKPLLWKYGGHRKPHKTLEIAEIHGLLIRICELLGNPFVDASNDPKQRHLLRDLDFVEVYFTEDEEFRERSKEQCFFLLAGLSTRTHLRK